MSMSLLDIFLECQDSQNQHHLIKTFKKVYSNTPLDEFWEEFLRLIKHPLSVFGREPVVEKTVDFIAKAVTDLANNDKKEPTKSSSTVAESEKNESAADDGNEDDEDEMHPLLLRLFKFLLDVHSASDRGVRFRVCQLVTRMLQYLGEGAQIDDALYDSIYRCMVERLRDKCPAVRVHAVLALARLQDPLDEACPITKAYIILMTKDPYAEVRRVVLTSIAPSTTSLPAILERTRDVKDTVRKTAYTYIAEKIPLRALKIEQRIQLLHDGLNERSEAVKAACSNKLLQAWLCACEGNVLDLLARFDVQSSVETCEQALNILFKNSGILDLVQKFDIINERALIDEEKLTCESAFYWRILTQFIHSAGHDYEEQLDQVRPNCVEFCSFIEKYAEKLASCSDVDEMFDVEFIIHQLLKILSLMDVTDQTSRKATEKILHKLIVSESVGPSLVQHILPCLKEIHPGAENFINCLAESISEIREPITTVEKNLTGEARREIDKKIAGIKVKVNLLRDTLEEHVQKQEFEHAAQVKAEISILDQERSALMEETEPVMEEVRTQKNDPLTIMKCLTIVSELLISVNLKTFVPALQALMDSQILPGMTNEEAEIRNLAVKAIGLCCLIKKDIILQHLPLLLQASQMDTQLVRATSLKAIFDLVHVFGLEAFSDEVDVSQPPASEESCASQVREEQDESSSPVAEITADQTSNTTSGASFDEKKGWSETAAKVIAILSANLDDENPELRNIAAEGLAKLLLCGRVVSSKLLSHLLLLWYNPMIEDDDTLLQCLGVFFPLFAYSSSSNQELVEEAFLPTLKTLLHAPSTSPLAEVNEVNMANFLVEITDAWHLIDNQKSKDVVTDNPCHDSLSVKLCNEILSKPDSFNVKLWLRVLGNLRLSPDNVTLLKDLSAMCEDMAMVVTDKTCTKLFEKFRHIVENMLENVTQDSREEAQDTVTKEPDSGEAQTATANEERGRGDSEMTRQVSQTPAVPPSAKRKKAKTPAVGKSTGRTRNSALKSGHKLLDSSNLDDSVFTTPGPIKGSRMAAEVEDARVNLENLLVESASKVSASGKTPKTPKRPLHSIQDPSFTG